MFSHENSVSLRFFNTCSLKRFISCNGDNSVQTVKRVDSYKWKYVYSMATPCSNRGSTLNLTL